MSREEKQHHRHLDLYAIAQQTMRDAGFEPDLNDAMQAELRNAHQPPANSIKDLRQLLWSSIDDEKSRDLDQVEFAEAGSSGQIKLLIGIADVDAVVPKDSAVDKHAAHNCTSVYTGVRTFPMLPEELSTDLTSLIANQDRRAVVTELLVAADGTVTCTDFYSALIRNHAKLAYERIGPWLDGQAPVPDEVKAVAGLEEQIKLQHEAAKDFGELRKKHGAIELGTIQSTPVMDDGRVVDLSITESNAARDLIENFMIGANVAIAKFLEDHGGPSIRRVVHTPKFWPRIVEIASEAGEQLPDAPDLRALADFLARRKVADPVHFPDLSLAIVKSLGPGEYEVQLPGEQGEGHFGLAVDDYTHSTAPNRRFADLVTQRLVKAVIAKTPPPYSNDELREIAAHCTERENAARKVQRKMRKVAAALLLKNQIGSQFNAIVTGATEKGTFARIVKPPVDGRVVKGDRGMRVGEKVKVRLISTDPERGFIDFARV
ncbi:MAG TPA: RNB domain-containing ribonuclease [Pyrinomonadaceae bacterium]|nr:RNB domain-containing ribonuclease [Pyrinomonadaceae bacterium]